MRTAYYHGPPLPTRSHPWTTVVNDGDGEYYDFKASPNLIRTAIEDLVPWRSDAAIETLFELIEWLNRPGGELETNDCQFTGPTLDASAATADRAVSCSGRLMMLFRNLPYNQAARHTDSLARRLHETLNAYDDPFQLGLIATARVPIRLIAMNPVMLGSQLMISFWAWGKSDVAAMHNLHRLMHNLQRGLRLVMVERIDDQTA